MYMIRKGKIKKVKVLSIKNGTPTTFTVQDSETKKVVENVHNYDICDTYNEAKLALEEIVIKGKFKKSRRNKKGDHTCSWCGKQGKNLTVDHKRALDSFGGRKTIRRNLKAWKRAWSFNNLQILCEECNKNKSNFTNTDGKMSLDDIDYHARVLNNKKILKQSINKDSFAGKVGYGIATGRRANNKKELAEYVAKADSNVLRLDIILSGMEAYEHLPKTI